MLVKLCCHCSDRKLYLFYLWYSRQDFLETIQDFLLVYTGGDPKFGQISVKSEEIIREYVDGLVLLQFQFQSNLNNIFHLHLMKKATFPNISSGASDVTKVL